MQLPEFNPLLGAAGVALWGLYLIMSGVIRWIREKPSEFAAAIARSMKSDPDCWNYTHDETWLISERASLEISLQDGNFGRVNSRDRTNSGTTNIVTLDGADRRAFCAAYRKWRDLTAIERTSLSERRKRNAITALAA